jgi:hypothetical protein
MNKWIRPVPVLSLATLAAFVPAALAYACVGIMALTTSASAVEPGGTITVFGNSFAQDEPIDIHLDSPTGPILATVPPPASTMTSKFEIPVVIPADTPKGQHLLVATQVYHHMNAGAPARASIQVGSTAPAVAPVSAVRPAAVTIGSGPSGLFLGFVGLTVAAVALIIVGLVSLLSSGRRPEGKAVAA